jgi:hypothetical protein
MAIMPLKKNNMTPVELLIKEIQDEQPKSKAIWDITYEQARIMERSLLRQFFIMGGQQAFNAGKGRDFKTFEEIYEETFNNPKQ